MVQTLSKTLQKNHIHPLTFIHFLWLARHKRMRVNPPKFTDTSPLQCTTCMLSSACMHITLTGGSWLGSWWLTLTCWLGAYENRCKQNHPEYCNIFPLLFFFRGKNIESSTFNFRLIMQQCTIQINLILTFWHSRIERCRQHTVLKVLSGDETRVWNENINELIIYNEQERLRNKGSTCTCTTSPTLTPGGGFTLQLR